MIGPTTPTLCNSYCASRTDTGGAGGLQHSPADFLTNNCPPYPSRVFGQGGKMPPPPPPVVSLIRGEIVIGEKCQNFSPLHHRFLYLSLLRIELA